MTVVDDIKSRLDLTEMISGYVSLQQSGRGYKANCPFHQERTPSFIVNPELQTWHCFGACATGGDVFAFIMRAENLEFGEALRRLAQQAGVALPSLERRNEQDIYYRANEAARGYFQQELAAASGAETRSYLTRRGVNEKSVEKFQLGLSPREGRGLIDYLGQHDFSPEQLVKAGLAHQNQDGNYRDAFRGRLMIPIRNGAGELSGFGSRAVDDAATPKYLNTARTPAFDKGRLLYGLYLAKESARRQGIVIVEGYMDAIMAHQQGFDNVVASMGTALTEHQVAEVRRLTGRVTMALDADAAGQQATLRSLESSWQVFQTRPVQRSRNSTLFQRPNDLELKIALLPEGQDPDQVIRQSPENWKGLVRDAVPLFEYLLPALSAQADISTPQGKARLVELLFPFIAAIPEPIQQDHYFQMLAERLKVSEDTLRASASQLAARNRAAPPQTGASAASRPTNEGKAVPSALTELDRDPLEEYCLALLLQRPEELSENKPPIGLSLDYFRRPENREIYHRLTEAWAKGTGEGPQDSVAQRLRQEIPEELAEHLAALTRKKLPPIEPRNRDSALRNAATRLEERYLKELKLAEQARFADEPSDLPDESGQAALELNRRLKANQKSRNQSAHNSFRGR